MGEVKKEVIKERTGILLDIGCGENKNDGFVGMDRRPLKGVDIVHDLEVFPYPLEDNSCLAIVGSHIVEHIKPWIMLEFMNELWRIMKPGGRLAFSHPYGWSHGYIQDPTHCNPCNETTWMYFDHRHPLWRIYKPKPWALGKNSPVWQVTGNMEVLMRKVVLDGKQ